MKHPFSYLPHARQILIRTKQTLPSMAYTKHIFPALAMAALGLMQPACANSGAKTANATDTANAATSSTETKTTPMDNSQAAVDSPGFMKTASGLQYKITEHGKGEMAEAGDKVTAHYTGTLTNGKKFDSSKDRNQPFEFALGKGQVIGGWDEGFALLHVGDKATLIIPPQLGYGAQGAGADIPPNATLVFEVELLKVTKAMKPKAYDISHVKAEKTPSGVEIYRVHANPKGEQVKAGQTVKVHYTGYFEDGKIFDSSVERGEPIEFPIGTGRVIKGWDEAIPMLHVGEKARLKIPYAAAYGEQGRGPIPAKSNLIFDVEVVGTK